MWEGSSLNWRVYLWTLEKSCGKRAFSVFAKVVEIIPVSSEENSTVIGAASLILKEMFKITRDITSNRRKRWKIFLGDNYLLDTIQLHHPD